MSMTDAENNSIICMFNDFIEFSFVPRFTAGFLFSSLPLLWEFASDELLSPVY